MECDPTASVQVESVAVPAPSGLTLPITALPSLKVTGPVGVPGRRGDDGGERDRDPELGRALRRGGRQRDRARQTIHGLGDGGKPWLQPRASRRVVLRRDDVRTDGEGRRGKRRAPLEMGQCRATSHRRGTRPNRSRARRCAAERRGERDRLTRASDGFRGRDEVGADTVDDDVLVERVAPSSQFGPLKMAVGDACPRGAWRS